MTEPWLPWACQCDARLQEGLGGGSRELQACQCDLGAGEGCGAAHLECVHQHMQDSQGIRPSQRGFMKGRSCLTNPISFCDQVTPLVDEGKAMDVIYLGLVRPLSLFPTASSWRNWLFMVWMGVHCPG